MAKVSDMIGDYAEPRGNAGYSVDHDIASAVTAEMRRIMALDLEELDVATAVQVYNAEVDSEEMIAAWELLNTTERASWRRFVNYNEFLRNELKKRDVN
jgi:hypothetical protein